jgi:hypothetical protein
MGSERVAYRRGEARGILRRVAGCLLPVAVVFALAGQATAAKPRSGVCWGTCGGDSGPVGGYFVVAKNQVQGFLISEKCLGTGRSGLLNEITNVPNMSVNRGGSFSFNGKAQRATLSRGQSVRRSVKVTLMGMFVTPTKASISLKIGYKKCGTKHATIVAR